MIHKLGFSKAAVVQHTFLAKLTSLDHYSINTSFKVYDFESQHATGPSKSSYPSTQTKAVQIQIQKTSEDLLGPGKNVPPTTSNDVCGQRFYPQTRLQHRHGPSPTNLYYRLNSCHCHHHHLVAAVIVVVLVDIVESNGVATWIALILLHSFSPLMTHSHFKFTTSFLHIHTCPHPKIKGCKTSSITSPISI